jgi:hypothetical protein
MHSGSEKEPLFAQSDFGGRVRLSLTAFLSTTIYEMESNLMYGNIAKEIKR